MSGVDKRTLNVLLALLGIDKHELAERMGYRDGYVKNVLCGVAKASPSFRQAFGAAITELILPPEDDRPQVYPAGPLAELVHRRAAEAPCKEQFYNDLGISRHGWNKRAMVPEELVDRVCCALGVHPSSVYGADYEAAS